MSTDIYLYLIRFISKYYINYYFFYKMSENCEKYGLLDSVSMKQQTQYKVMLV